MQYATMSLEELNTLFNEEKKNYDVLVKGKHNVDISRGKPCKEQLDAVMGIFDTISSETNFVLNSDLRNYGDLKGISGLRKIFAEILGVGENNCIVGNNSSLNIMYDTVQRAMQFGVLGSKPWNTGEVKFLCPAPGYDRHFTICEHFGIEMITVPMTEVGPDMDIVENLVATDPAIQGMWCVPKYSNPTGVTYSDEVVDRLAKMKVASSDFRIFWDNAYAVHSIYEHDDRLKNIYESAKAYLNEDRVYIFTSTSKITFPGSGVACIAASDANIADITSHYQFQTIGPNKINQYMHLQFIKNTDNLKEIMRMHAKIIAPKFDKIIGCLTKNFNDCQDVKFTKPNGGYFISLDVRVGCASEVGRLCKEAGLILTNIGATYPYGIDDNDQNIRIAPTFTSNDELEIACNILVTCIKLAIIKSYINEK